MSNVEKAELQLTKEFPVPADVLYQAWTNDGELKQWWKPMGKNLESVENDIREGGAVRYRFQDGLEISGEYKEVQEGKRLVYSWIWRFPEASLHNGDYVLTVEFAEAGEGSGLSVTQSASHDEHAIQPHEEGWQEALDALHSHLSKRTQAN